MNTPRRTLRRNILLCLAAPILIALPVASSSVTATGGFEVYCDGVGIFLSKIDGAPAPGKLVLFSYADFPPGAMQGIYLSGRWSEVFVYRDGCVPDGKCENIANHAKVWVDAWDTSDMANLPPKHISGKYEIDLNGKMLQGSFVAKEHVRKHPIRVCM